MLAVIAGASWSKPTKFTPVPVDANVIDLTADPDMWNSPRDVRGLGSLF